jgi:hypothetical protein
MASVCNRMSSEDRLAGRGLRAPESSGIFALQNAMRMWLDTLLDGPVRVGVRWCRFPFSKREIVLSVVARVAASEARI